MKRLSHVRPYGIGLVRYDKLGKDSLYIRSKEESSLNLLGNHEIDFLVGHEYIRGQT